MLKLGHKPCTRGPLFNDVPRGRTPLGKLLERPWSRRFWIIQEMLDAKTVILVCASAGRAIVSFEQSQVPQGLNYLIDETLTCDLTRNGTQTPFTRT